MTAATAGPSGVPVEVWRALVGLVRRWAVAEFEVPGDPVSWQRAGRNGKRTFTPKRTAAGEKAVAEAFVAANPEWQTDNSTPWGVLLEFHVEKLTTKDLDNMIKLVFDGLNGTFWRDDQQVADLLVRVERGVVDPRTIVVLYPTTDNLHRRPRSASTRWFDDALRRRVYNFIAVEAMAGRRPGLDAIGQTVGLTARKAGDVVRSLESDGYLTRSPTRPYTVKIHKPYPREP